MYYKYFIMSEKCEICKCFSVKLFLIQKLKILKNDESQLLEAKTM